MNKRVMDMTDEDSEFEKKKPCVALMGEFSAGKSTLINLLLGGDPLPVRVTATQLPPVWISYGSEAAFRVGMDGTETPLDLADLETVKLEDTRFIRLFLEAETLQLCDLIDMPGISDPNMSHDVWQTAMREADSVIWCTHATQAWRQSEAATWESIQPHTNGDNLLLVTQFDKLRTERDRERVLARIRKETKDQFKSIFPVALIEALNAGENVEIWKNSGAAAFTEALVEMLLSPTQTKMASTREAFDFALKSNDNAEEMVLPNVQTEHAIEPSEPDLVSSNAETLDRQIIQVIPNRVRRKAAKRLRTRPLRRLDQKTDTAPPEMEVADEM
jgi:GTPase SAR1 family protein